MKRCPQCNRLETDDALGFCRQDGANLISDTGRMGAEAGMMKFGSAPVSKKIEPSVLPRTSTSPEINRPTAPATVLPAKQPPGATLALGKPKRRKPIVAMAAVIAVALIAGVYLYWARVKKTAPIE